MSLYPDIEFSNKLTKNRYSLISYSGYLFKNNSEYVNIVYGFGDDWKHTTEQQMEKTENGFVANIKMLEFDKINFCFKNSNNEWDNNYCNNFSAPISQTEEEYSFIINEEEVLDNILENLTKFDISKYKDELEDFNTKEIVTQIAEEKIVEKPQEIVEDKIEDSFEEESNIEPFEIDVTVNEPVEIEESLISSIEESSLNEDIENIFTENIEEQKNSFNMDSLIDEILSPIMESDEFEPASYVFTEDDEQNLDKIQNFELNDNVIEFNDSEKELQKDQEIDTKINNLINELYSNVDNEVQEENSVQIENTEDTVQDIQEEISNDNSNLDLTDLFEDINDEESLIEEISSESVKTIENVNSEKIEKIQESTNTALVEVNDKFVLVSPRSLNKFNRFKKRVRLAIYKFFTAIPKILASGFEENSDK